MTDHLTYTANNSGRTVTLLNATKSAITFRYDVSGNEHTVPRTQFFANFTKAQ
jgi:hypothetical protein